MKLDVRSWYAVNGGDLVITAVEVRGWLALILGPARERTWRGHSTVWSDHTTAERADTLTELELTRLAKLIRWGSLDALKASACGAQTTTTPGCR